jgi:hypothetical protein
MKINTNQKDTPSPFKGISDLEHFLSVTPRDNEPSTDQYPLNLIVAITLRFMEKGQSAKQAAKQTTALLEECSHARDAIQRNRANKDKPGGLVVDYIGIAAELKNALRTYTDAKGKGRPTLEAEEALSVLREKLDVTK